MLFGDVKICQTLQRYDLRVLDAAAWCVKGKDARLPLILSLQKNISSQMRDSECSQRSFLQLI